MYTRRHYTRSLVISEGIMLDLSDGRRFRVQSASSHQACPNPGDSGGPLFLETKDGGWRLGGIHCRGNLLPVALLDREEKLVECHWSFWEFLDCDGDTLLAIAQPQGPTCLRSTPSCFDGLAPVAWLERLQGLLDLNEFSIRREFKPLIKHLSWEPQDVLQSPAQAQRSADPGASLAGFNNPFRHQR